MLLEKTKRYLISSYFGDKILITSEMAKFYLDLGLKITRIYEFVQFHLSKYFQSLSLQIAKDRRTGDRDPDSQILTMTSKLTGSSLYSALPLSIHFHCDSSYHDDTTVHDIINSPYFSHLNVIKEELCEVKCLKKQIKNNLSIQIEINMYMNAKLHMVKFYYLFLKKFIPHCQFQLIESDTDSYYFSISKDSLDDCVPVNLRREHCTEKRLWMPTEVCDHHSKDFVETKVSGNKWSLPFCC